MRRSRSPRLRESTSETSCFWNAASRRLPLESVELADERAAHPLHDMVEALVRVLECRAHRGRVRRGVHLRREVEVRYLALNALDLVAHEVVTPRREHLLKGLAHLLDELDLYLLGVDRGLRGQPKGLKLLELSHDLRSDRVELRVRLERRVYVDDPRLQLLVAQTERELGEVEPPLRRLGNRRRNGSKRRFRSAHAPMVPERRVRDQPLVSSSSRRRGGVKFSGRCGPMSA